MCRTRSIRRCAICSPSTPRDCSRGFMRMRGSARPMSVTAAGSRCSSAATPWDIISRRFRRRPAIRAFRRRRANAFLRVSGVSVTSCQSAVHGIAASSGGRLWRRGRGSKRSLTTWSGAERTSQRRRGCRGIRCTSCLRGSLMPMMRPDMRPRSTRPPRSGIGRRGVRSHGMRTRAMPSSASSTAG